jgi:hypothetical protein
MRFLIRLRQDEYRLPEGMGRMGYDADTGKYIYEDQDGSTWEGVEAASLGPRCKIAGTSSVDCSSQSLSAIQMPRPRSPQKKQRMTPRMSMNPFRLL